ncbi:MAG TPA: hypothetical protein VHL53_14300 [Acidimicrobiia bacterium]|nr:hypothetical protein [Acidimicrobiia bacterium]
MAGAGARGMTDGRGGRPAVGAGWWLRAGAGVLRRPGLWPIALRQALRLARPGWWRRAPFLPLPDPDYVRFRLQTAYGPRGEPAPADLAAYLHWCREFDAS